MGPSTRVTDAVLRKEQAGFRKHRDCTDQIFALRNIIEQRTEWQRQLYVNFVDFEKAFNSVHPEHLWNIIRHYCIPSKLVHVIKSFYNNFRCSVEHNNIFINLDFADDPVLLSHTHHHIQEKTNRLHTNRQQVGLRISKKKTEIMTLSVEAPVHFKIRDEELHETDNFTYLGSITTQKSIAKEDIHSRLDKARWVFRDMNNIWRSAQYSTRTKLKLSKSSVVSTLLYRSGSWRITETDLSKLHHSTRHACAEYLKYSDQKK